VGYSSRCSFLSSRPQLESLLLRETLPDALRSALATSVSAPHLLCGTSYGSHSCYLSVPLLYGLSFPHLAVRSLRAGPMTVSLPAVSLASSPVSCLLRALSTHLLNANRWTRGREQTVGTGLTSASAWLRDHRQAAGPLWASSKP